MEYDPACGEESEGMEENTAGEEESEGMEENTAVEEESEDIEENTADEEESEEYDCSNDAATPCVTEYEENTPDDDHDDEEIDQNSWVPSTNFDDEIATFDASRLKEGEVAPPTPSAQIKKV